jgi:hypothetical protein
VAGDVSLQTKRTQGLVGVRYGWFIFMGMIEFGGIHNSISGAF